MVKTKTRSKVKTKSSLVKTEPILPKKTSAVCFSSCWVCSIFKLMVVMFVVMIIFWLGFSIGELSSQPYTKSYRNISLGQSNCAKNIKPAGKMCPGNMANLANDKINLASKTGDEFDKEFLLQMTVNNQSSIEMAQLALTKSSREEVKTLAQQIIDTQTKDIDQMKLWQVDWFTVK